MRMYDVIYKKRKGGELTEEEIRSFISGYVAGEIPDYQASALLMAICFNGMNEAETAILTDAVANSGDTVDLSRFGTLTADKHSTGGVGDKTSLIVAPLAASLGAVVTKMSGRGLGHTGGTVDKLESIPGYRTALSAEEFIAQAERVGIVVVGQSGNMTPADKKLYALRDVTAT
ncbi:MAG: thymidine phosphorylase, partial [Clostridia bacterium]|nr:thymidine phosphorylase [Clostridia bacterium]